MAAKKTQITTVNGVTKGRPVRGKALSLGQRKTCYHGHRMTKENTFTYHKRVWCKKCRATSRKSSRTRRLAEAKAAARKVASTKAKAKASTRKVSTKASSRKAA